MRRIVLPLVIILLVAGYTGVFYYYENVSVPAREKEAVELYKQQVGFEYTTMKPVARMKKNVGIDKYTVIDQAMVDEYVEFVQMPLVVAEAGVIETKEELVNKVTKEEITPGEIILKEALEDNQVWFGDYDRIKDYKIKTNLSGTLKEGMLVDIIVVYANGDYDVVVPKQKVLKLVDLAESGPNVDKTKGSFEILVSIPNENDYRDMVLADTMGVFELRRYHDVGQPASEKTFDYKKMLAVKKLEEIIVSQKTGSDESPEGTTIIELNDGGTPDEFDGQSLDANINN